MIELIRDWLVGITCGAIIVALADGLSPSGTVRKIGRLTGSLVLVLAMILCIPVERCGAELPWTCPLWLQGAACAAPPDRGRVQGGAAFFSNCCRGGHFFKLSHCKGGENLLRCG